MLVRRSCATGLLLSVLLSSLLLSTSELQWSSFEAPIPQSATAFNIKAISEDCFLVDMTLPLITERNCIDMQQQLQVSMSCHTFRLCVESLNGLADLFLESVTWEVSECSQWLFRPWTDRPAISSSLCTASHALSHIHSEYAPHTSSGMALRNSNHIWQFSSTEASQAWILIELLAFQSFYLWNSDIPYWAKYAVPVSTV